MKAHYKRKWTNFNNEPKLIFKEACEIIADYFLDYGFVYQKSKKWLLKTNEEYKLSYFISLGTNRYNSKGFSVNLNSQCLIKSCEIQKFRNDRLNMTNNTDDVITSFQLGYLMPEQEYTSWNLYKTHPKKIAEFHLKYAIPTFDKFKEPNKIINHLLREGKIPEFDFYFRILDYIMCYGDEEISIRWVKKILEVNRLGSKFEKLYPSISNGEEIDKKYKDMDFLLFERINNYGLIL